VIPGMQMESWTS